MKKENYFFLFKKIISFLSFRRKVLVLIYFFMSIVSGFFELISIAMVIPFMNLMLNTENTLNYFEKIGIHFEDYLFFEYMTPKISIGIIFIILIFISALFRILLHYYGQKNANFVIYEFSVLTYKKILNINDISNKYLNESNLLTTLQKISNLSSFFLNFNSIFSNLIIFIFIFFIICFFMSYQIFFLGVTFILIYYLIIYLFKSKLQKNSKLELKLYSLKNNHLLNTVGFYKELILNNLKQIFLEIFKDYTYKSSKISITNNSIAFLPGIVLVNFTVIILVVYILLITNNNSLASLIPILSAIIYGTQKIIPLLQLIYSSISRLKEHYYQTQSFISSLNSLGGSYEENQKNSLNKFFFKNQIEFKKLSFKYSNKKKYVIKNLNLLIKKNDKILIIGKSGIGKSSLLNIILGLLQPNSGKILIDNQLIKKNDYKNFQNNFSYCSQNIYLANDTISNNITLSFNNYKIDKKRILNSSKAAEINNFILSQTNQYQTIINQSGRNISGGQTQRIGIARTLYKDSEIYIFDESTNAIDSKTEKKIFNNLFKKNLRNKTVIFISHKTNNISYFNKVFVLKNKKLHIIKKNLNN